MRKFVSGFGMVNVGSRLAVSYFFTTKAFQKWLSVARIAKEKLR